MLNKVILEVVGIEREMEHFEIFCCISSLYGENSMFCKSEKEVFQILRCPC